jgi:hypothetical protein
MSVWRAVSDSGAAPTAGTSMGNSPSPKDMSSITSIVTVVAR